MANHTTIYGRTWDTSSTPGDWDTIFQDDIEAGLGNARYLKDVKGDVIGANTSPNISSDGGGTFWVVLAGSGGPNSVNLFDPADEGQTNFSTNLSKRIIEISGTIRWGAGSAALPGGGDEEFLATHVKASTVDPEVRGVPEAGRAHVTGSWFFYSGTGIADQSGDAGRKASETYAGKDLVFYLDSNDGILKMFWDHTAGIACALRVSISPKFDV